MGAYGKPTILLHLTHNGLAKGSCRSIPAFNMFDALHANRDLIEQFGGHPWLQGFTQDRKCTVIKGKLRSAYCTQLTAYDFKLKLVLDAHAMLPEFTQKFVDDIDHLEPFGNENRAPLFFIKEVVLLQKPTLLKDVAC